MTTDTTDRPADIEDEEPIRRTRVSDQIVERLEAQIRSGAYLVGHTLPSERELMRRFGVGRPAVREALFRLSKRGIVEVRSGMKPRVRAPDASVVLDDLNSVAKHFLSQPEGVANFQQLRTYLEVALARDAANKGSEADMERLREALAANKAAIGDRERFIETDIAFHFVLAKRTRNPIIIAFHAAMGRWLYEQRLVALRVPDIEPVSYADHEAICRAVAGRDADAAEREMERHLADVARNYWAGRGETPRAPGGDQH
ncbi:MAG: FCD domain-containing protein [Bauldia sp.]